MILSVHKALIDATITPCNWVDHQFLLSIVNIKIVAISKLINAYEIFITNRFRKFYSLTFTFPFSSNKMCSFRSLFWCLLFTMVFAEGFTLKVDSRGTIVDVEDKEVKDRCNACLIIVMSLSFGDIAEAFSVTCRILLSIIWTCICCPLCSQIIFLAGNPRITSQEMVAPFPTSTRWRVGVTCSESGAKIWDVVQCQLTNN